MAKMSNSLTEIIRVKNLIPPGTKTLVLLSGGVDSVCLLHVLRTVVGPDRLTALHVNHGLREAADADQMFCAQLCGNLGVEMHVEALRLDPQAGNVEGQARQARYRFAGAACDQLGFDLIATGHTANDQAETMLYRLACSPGRRALLGVAERSGRIVRPLLEITRDQVRDYCTENGLEWREDESNEDRSFARNRIRHEILPALEKIHPAAQANMLATGDELRDESAVLDSVVEAAISAAGAGGNPPAVEVAQIAGLAPAVRRLVLRRLAERAASGPVPLTSARVKQLEQLALSEGSSQLDLPGGIRATCEYGMVRFAVATESESVAPVDLTVPGSCQFGTWNVVSELEPDGPASLRLALRSPDEALLDASKLSGSLRVRAWQDGDRMQPLGLSGTKSLQDLFTDLKVPRALRRELPVVTSGNEIVWVAGVAMSETLKVTEGTAGAVRLRARTSA